MQWLYLGFWAQQENRIAGAGGSEAAAAQGGPRGWRWLLTVHFCCCRTGSLQAVMWLLIVHSTGHPPQLWALEPARDLGVRGVYQAILFLQEVIFLPTMYHMLVHVPGDDKTFAILLRHHWCFYVEEMAPGYVKEYPFIHRFYD